MMGCISISEFLTFRSSPYFFEICKTSFLKSLSAKGEILISSNRLLRDTGTSFPFTGGVLKVFS